MRGEGVWLTTDDGRTLLDAYNNVPSVGHANPRVLEALCRQAGVLNTHTRYLHEGVVRYAERLTADMPPGLGSAVFTCSGSEANDLALRMANAWHGGTGVIVTSNAYHGVTAAAAQASPSLGPVAPHVRTVAPPLGHEPAEAFAAAVAAAAADLHAAGHGPATLLADSVMASDGVVTDAEGALAAAAEAVRAAGGLYVADEIQAGFGRLGRMWGFQHHGAVPDIATLGKPMGNGHPIGGLVARTDIADRFGRRTRYFNTFGGNTVSAAVGLAVLDEIEDRNLVEHARAEGAHLGSALARLADRHPAVVSAVRGTGLYYGIELRDGAASPADLTTAALEGLLARGVLVGRCGPADNVIKVRPPLVIAPPELELLTDALDATLADLTTP